MTEELKPLPCPFEEWFEERFGDGNLFFKEQWRDLAREVWGAALARSPAWRDDMEGLHKAASEVAAAYWDIDQDGPDSPCVKLLFDRMKALTDVLWELRRENPPHPLGIPLPPEEGRG